LAALALGAASLAGGPVGCGGTASVADRPCPCADGNVCCATTNRCVATAAACAGGDGGGGIVDPSALKVFVTRGQHDGNFGGLAGADAFCANAASSVALGGNWIAWLSDSKTQANDRVKGNGPWYLVGESSPIFADRTALTGAHTSPFDRDERGTHYSPAYVWIGLDPFHPLTTCNDWTSTADGTTGTGVFAGDIAVNISAISCKIPQALICIQQP
jgi:hypothetical protein